LIAGTFDGSEEVAGGEGFVFVGFFVISGVVVAGGVCFFPRITRKSCAEQE